MSCQERPPHFQVLDCNLKTLLSLMEEAAGPERSAILEKTHPTYFANYLSTSGLSAKTIIVERNYTDHDYVEDYAEHYSRCFKTYPKTCFRLHFFKEYRPGSGKGITPEEFGGLLSRWNEELWKLLNDAYLGFVILKPLPRTVVGRTCLKTYDNDGGRRQYKGIKPFEVNLFGLPLEVESLPYQEQDSEVAACATSAIWTMLHGSALLFHHPTLSPAAVTMKAGAHSPSGSGYFPNSGLTLEEMATAVRAVGLAPITYSANNAYSFFSVVYAYLSFGLPLALACKLYKVSDGNSLTPDELHAVTITGYSKPTGQAPAPLEGQLDLAENRELMRLEASRLDEIYVHDDQVGPFARMEIPKKEYLGKDDLPWKSFLLTTSLGTKQDREEPKYLAEPVAVLIPVLPMIRVPYEKVHKAIQAFDAVLSILFRYKIRWDICLMKNNDYKKMLLQSEASGRTLAKLEDILTTNLPRYVWKASAIIDEILVADFLLDATDLLQGVLLTLPVHYEETLPQCINAILELEGAEAVHSKCREILGHYKIKKEQIASAS